MTSPLRDARLVEDAASGASVHNLPQVNASVLPVTCVEYDSLMVKRVYNSRATVKPIITTYMHIVSMEGSVMIMNARAGDASTRSDAAHTRALTHARTCGSSALKRFCKLLSFLRRPSVVPAWPS